MRTAPILIAQPPSDRQRLPTEMWEPLMLVLRYVSFIGIFACVAALVVFGAMLGYQRTHNAGQILQDKTLVRICACAVLVGSAATIGNRLIV
ncbi:MULTISPECIES: hypothetical protein [Rhodococcus]|uniref:Uncharacterized protein n=1 Tax=Rhodococcus qingshengii JCM 15477 TaxID=1303681 RepID=A0AB38RN29_RHOSG|nr:MULTISPECIES: hypothetical protein [Rhodococcus]UPU46243.1 hypothetical protein M0639_29795 [Rhodococcus qingshengii JCM 15477]